MASQNGSGEVSSSFRLLSSRAFPIWSIKTSSEEVRLAKVAETSALIAVRAVLLFLTSPLNSLRAFPLEFEREIRDSRESCI